jgi:hypothetical protein
MCREWKSECPYVGILIWALECAFCLIHFVCYDNLSLSLVGSIRVLETTTSGLQEEQLFRCEQINHD